MAQTVLNPETYTWETDLTPQARVYVERARALAPGLAARKAATEARRSVPPETIAEFREAGFFRIVRPTRWGGDEVPYSAIAHVLAELAYGCPSSSWVYGVLSTHSMFLSLWPDEVQEMVWGRDNDVLISSAFMPRMVEDTGDGVVLKGQWSFSSGNEHADWVMIGALSPTRGPLMALTPLSEARKLDDWHTMGMRGTGSNSLEFDGTFVPNERLVPFGNLGMLHRPSNAHPQSFWDTHCCGAFGLYNFSCVTVGIARRALDLAKEALRGPGMGGGRRGDVSTVQMRFAEAAADIEMTCAQMMESCDKLYSLWQGGQPLTPIRFAQHRRDLCVMVWRLRHAVEKLTTLQNSWLYDTSPMQQLLRDISVASSHRSANVDDIMLPYAQLVVDQAA